MNTFVSQDGRIIKYQPTIKLKYEKNFIKLNEENIPKEIIFLILSYSNENDLLTLNSVSNQFYYFSTHDILWKEINYSKNKKKIFWPISRKKDKENWRNFYLKLSKVEKQVQNIWEKVKLFLSTSANYSLNLPATKEEILTLEKYFNVPLDIGFSLTLHNGSGKSSDETFSILGEYKFSSIDEMIEDYQILKEKEITNYMPLSDYFQSSKFYCYDLEGRIFIMNHGGEIVKMNNSWLEYLCNLIDAKLIE